MTVAHTLIMRYKQYLKSAQWQNKREQVYKKKKRECYICGTNKNVQLHHRSYKRVGNENVADLVPLCGYHHKQVEMLVKKKVVSRWLAHVFLKRKLQG